MELFPGRPLYAVVASVQFSFNIIKVPRDYLQISLLTSNFTCNKENLSKLINSCSSFWWFQGKKKLINSLKDTLKASTILKTSKKSVWCFLTHKSMYILKKCIQYTMQSDITQILKKFSPCKMNGTKNAVIFLSWAPTHRSFTFDLRFLYQLKRKDRLFKTVCGIFYFRIVTFK